MGSQSHLAVMLIISYTFLFLTSTKLISAHSSINEDNSGVDKNLSSTCRTQDSLTLVDFYESTRGLEWLIKWDLSKPINTWHGITLNEAGCVSCIDLDGDIGCTISVSFGNGLTGYLPETIGNLSSLEKLLLGNNRISSVLPERLFELPNIKVIDIFANEMIGPLPANMGHAEQMETLSLSGNNIGGVIPSSIGKAISLKDLFLDNNRLTGTIPEEIGNARALRRIRINNNQITGAIPLEIGQLTQLISLNAAENKLIQSIPSEIGQMTNMQDLILANNQISGAIPIEIGNLQELRIFRICNNLLTGSLPTQVGKLKMLEQFWANDNSLISEIPKEIGNCEKLSDFRLNNNLLDGEIPKEIGNLKYLRKLNLSFNKLVGQFPNNLDSLRRLQELIISDNKLSQELPEQIGTLSSIKIIRAENNLLQGPLPSSISNLERLSELQLSNNLINGNIPYDYGKSESLYKLDLSNNKLSGCFPESLMDKCDKEFSFENNSELPWLGDFQLFCAGNDQLDSKCSTETGATGESIQSDCSCAIFTCIPIHVTQDAFICGSEPIIFGNNSYNEPGQVIDSLLSSKGCDSIITINIVQLAIEIKTTDVTCAGDTNGSMQASTSIVGSYDYAVYNSQNEVIALGEQVHQVPEIASILTEGKYKLVLFETDLGCRITSEFEIFSEYLLEPETYEQGIKCDDESIVVNGNLYDSENRTGIEILKTINGCDSTIIIDLDFLNYELAITEIGCENESSGRVTCTPAHPELLYNFSLSNDSDEIIISGHTSGSDDPAFFDSKNTLEPGSYKLEIIASELGCNYEMLIEIPSLYNNPEPSYLEQLLCPGESIFVNENEYNENKPQGIETLSSYNGCDSIVNIHLSYLVLPVAKDDFKMASQENEIDVLSNDLTTSNASVVITILDYENADGVTINSEQELVVSIDQNFSGLTTILYEICVEDCDLCSSARARISTEGDGFDEDIITPNNDGYNEVLTVSGYSDYEKIPECTINIINRWGQVVYSKDNYSNDWAGFRDGDKSKPLAEGVYYYHLLYRNGRSAMGSRSLIR